VVFSREGPLGINLESSDDGLNAYVVSSESEKIKPGHLLMAVNNEPLEGLSFDDILDKVGKASWPRTLSFSAVQRGDVGSAEGTLPLPDDFFKEIADLSSYDEEEIKEFMQSHLANALKFVKMPPEDHGMRKATESDGIQVYLGDKLDSENEQVQMVLAKVQIPIPANLMMNAAVTCERSEFKRIFTMLDPMFGDGDVLHLIPKDYKRYGGKTERPEHLNLPLYSVKWGAWLLPFPLYNRDFVFCEFTTWAEGYGLSMCMSIPRITATVPDLEESHGIVRGNMGMTGYFWKDTDGSDPRKPVGENAMSIDLTYLLQINVKGSIPRWAVNLVGPQQGLNVKRVRDYALKQRDLLTHFFDENTELNGFEVREALVEKGKTFEKTIHVPEGFELVYEWICEDSDALFSIKAPDSSFILEPKSYDCNLITKPFHGRFKATQEGVYTLVWDNTSSWFSNRTVYYHQVVVDPNDPLPWPEWPSKAEILAAEKRN